MVGFIQEPSKEEEESGAIQQKLKTSNCPESYRFDFEGYSSEFGGFSLASVDSFLDFDSIKDWIEEMQVPDSKAENGHGACVENHLENQISDSLVDLVQGRNVSEKSVPVMTELSGSSEHMDSRDGLGGDDSLVKSDGIKECSVDGSKLADINSDAHLGDTKTSNEDGDDSRVGILDDRECHQIGSLDCSIEEGLEKVTLVGDGGLVVTGNGMKKVSTPVVSEDSDSSGSDSDADCETSSSSSSSASSSSSESDDDDEDVKVKEKEKPHIVTRENTEKIVDVEEGQIMDSDTENMVSWSEINGVEEEEDDDICNENSEEFQFEDDAVDEDGDVVKGPIKSKNELKILPPVPPVNVTLQPCHQILPVGVVLSVLGAQVIVEGSEKHDPLSEGSILWIVEKRLPLGLVDEIFGPVKTPYYIVRYNSESEVPSGIETGALVGFVSEFVGHVLNDKNLYQKGYDASGENDEELVDELYFSDDEKEAEYRRMLKMSKRGNNDQGQGPGNKRKNRKNKSRDQTWTKDQPSMSQSPRVQSSQPGQMQQHGLREPSSSERNQFGPSQTGPNFSGRPTVPSLSQSNQGPSPMRPFFPNGPTVFPQQMQQVQQQMQQQVQQAGFLLNGLFANGIPFQQQNMAMSSGFQMNGVPWMQQNHSQNLQVPSASSTPWQQQQHVSQMPLANHAQFQQPFDLSQLVAGAATPHGPMNFAAEPSNAPWFGMLGQNLINQGPLSIGLQGPGSQLPLPMSPAMMSNGLQGQNSNSQPPTSFQGNEGVSPQFNQGFSPGRGRGRKPFQRRRGHFGGGRGRKPAT